MPAHSYACLLKHPFIRRNTSQLQNLCSPRHLQFHTLKHTKDTQACRPTHIYTHTPAYLQIYHNSTLKKDKGIKTINPNHTIALPHHLSTLLFIFVGSQPKQVSKQHLIETLTADTLTQVQYCK